ncbi:MAG: hypothetical protein KGJ58_03160 [Patescibacteria group bacterium]|nr:hypothetical protein [Patescibacteria group bacterium]MDE1988743.1 hypothetical protein [Patescibacteria group bacterium]MDE2218423.1 hypothetical protein [Patescibacteria group bacterium]
MNNKNRSVITITDNDKNLSEIKILLRKLIGDEITFNQFTGIMDKDNFLRFYNRNSVLRKRKRFFKDYNRGKRRSKEIRMPVDKFVKFLDILARGDFGLDLGRFKKAIIYCANVSHFVGK